VYVYFSVVKHVAQIQPNSQGFIQLEAEVIHAAEDMNLLTASETSSFRTLAGALLWIAR
jgi:hypothetical protein